MKPVQLCLVICAFTIAARCVAEGASGENGTAKPTPPAPEERARELVNQLGSEKFSERQAAWDELKRLGRPALEPLREAHNSDDAEIRSRAGELLIEMRGRGFMGVQLQEQRDGKPVQDPRFMRLDGEEDTPDTEDPKVSKKPWIPAPDVVAIQVMRGYKPPMPAESAGLEDGDKFVSVNGRPVEGMTDLLREVVMAGPGTKAMIVVSRNGKKVTLAVDLTINPDDRPPVDLTNGEAKKRRENPEPVEE